MKRSAILAFVTACSSVYVGPASAQSACADVLRPTEDRSNEGNFALYSYVSAYAEDEYDRLQKLSESQRNLDATYKAFSGAFKSSRTKSEFRESIRRTLNETGYTSIENRMKSSHRSGLQDSQVTAWQNCMANSAGGLSLVAGQVSKSGFTLRGAWRPPMGHGADIIKIQLVGGTTPQGSQETTTIDLPVSGARNFRLIVNTTGNAKDIRVVAQTSAFGDDILVPVRPPVRHVESIIQECSENDPCPQDAKVVDCYNTDEHNKGKHGPEVPGSPKWLFGTDAVTSGTYAPRRIFFGNWSNPQCNVSGYGWHTPIGSCGVGGGNGFQRCAKVRVQFAKVTFREE